MATRFNIWWQACRPKTLTAAIAPVLVGTALAYAESNHNWSAALVALLGSILIQIGTNFANDYFDFVKGADTEERLGPTRATQAGLIQPETMKRAFLLTFLLAGLSGLYLVYLGGWLVFIFGSLSILSGILYTGGPKPLGYLGLGDIFVLFFFGLVATGGTYYVQALQLPSSVLMAGLCPGLLATAILAVNNLRDIDTDRKANKRTLAVRWGANFVKAEYFVCIIGANLITCYLVYHTQAHFLALLSLLSLLPSVPAMKKVLSVTGKELNPVLGSTGKILFIHSLLFSLGWVLS